MYFRFIILQIKKIHEATFVCSHRGLGCFKIRVLTIFFVNLCGFFTVLKLQLALIVTWWLVCLAVIRLGLVKLPTFIGFISRNVILLLPLLVLLTGRWLPSAASAPWKWLLRREFTSITLIHLSIQCTGHTINIPVTGGLPFLHWRVVSVAQCMCRKRDWREFEVLWQWSWLPGNTCEPATVTHSKRPRVVCWVDVTSCNTTLPPSCQLQTNFGRIAAWN